MFSDSAAPAPGEQKGFKRHTPHFIPWLRNSLKPHHSSDLVLNGPYKSSSEPHNNLPPLERAKGIGFFSIQGKDRKKGELRLNGVGMARILPVVLRGHHIPPGSLRKQREDCPAREDQSPEVHPDSNKGDLQQDLSNNSTSVQDQHSSLLQVHSDGNGTLLRKYRPLVGLPVETSPEEPNCIMPGMAGTDDQGVKVWDYAKNATNCQRELHSSSWLGSEHQEMTERQHGFISTYSYIKQKSMKSHSQRDLREPSLEGLNRPLSGITFSTEVPQKGLSCTTSLQGTRKPRSSEHTESQTWVQYSPASGRKLQRKEAGCSRKVVRNQIKRVVDNLEQVLRALTDVHQEMKEVVQQIDFLTSSIDLNEEEQQSATAGDGANSSTSGSRSSKVTLGGIHQRPSEPEEKPRTTESSATLRRDHHCRSLSPPNVLLSTVTSGFLKDKCPSLHFTSRVGPWQHNNNLRSSSPPQIQTISSHDFTLSPQKNIPFRPPTPGLSPLTVNLHHPGSPASQPHSPGPSTSIKISPSSPLSPQLKPPPTLCPSVIIENKIRPYQNPQSGHLSVGQACPLSAQPTSACSPNTNTETQTIANDHRSQQASSAGRVNGLSQVCTASAAPTKPPRAQGCRGRNPPPYPHHRTLEHTKKAKETRKAPPYPEKRRLLSTTV